jgi:nicotinate dehydrogenase subunit B
MTHVRRRGLLQALAGLTVTFALPRAAAAGPRSVAADAVEGFLAIAPDGAVTVYAGKVDLGTGARIALPQIVADELGAEIGRVGLVEGDTALTPDQGSTGGSTGIPVGAMQIRRAAATARERLLALGAARLDRPAGELEAVDGMVRPIGGGPGVAFAALLTEGLFALKVDPAVKLKAPAGFRFIGRPLPRPDVPAKMTGRHVFLQDFRLPGMLHARVIRPPAVGAELLAVDEAPIAGISGARVVRIKSFLAVVAPGEWNAIRAARALVSRWSEPRLLPGADQTYAAVRAAEVVTSEVFRQVGDTGPALARAARRLEASYHWPIQSHASMGPSCAVADVRDGGATVWTSSQGTHKNRRIFARFLGLPVERVRLIYMDGSGSFGTSGNDDAAADAALLSQALRLPVRVQWSREDELAWDPKGPPQVLDMRAGLDAAGNVTAWETEVLVPANTAGLAGIPLLALDAAEIAQPQGLSSGQMAGNADPPYAFPAIKATARWLRTTPLRPSNLRAPGKIGNVFAVECFADELAAAAGADPLGVRLRGLRAPRGIEVMRGVAAAMGWQWRRSPGVIDARAAMLRGRGIAYCHYKQAENFVAMGAEVEVERATGMVRVTRIVCAHDCGLMINPDNVRAQVEGCILQTLSRTLFEETLFDASRVTSVDFDSYPLLRFPDVPKLDIILIDRPDERALGVGEASASPVAAAVGNAIFDATGLRLRTAPFTPARVKAAFASAVL